MASFSSDSSVCSLPSCSNGGSYVSDKCFFVVWIELRCFRSVLDAEEPGIVAEIIRL